MLAFNCAWHLLLALNQNALLLVFIFSVIIEITELFVRLLEVVARFLRPCRTVVKSVNRELEFPRELEVPILS